MALIPKLIDGELITRYDVAGNQLTTYYGLDDPDAPQSLVDPTTPSGAQPLGVSGDYELTLSEEFNATMRVVDAATGHVKFRNSGGRWATWYPDWPRFNSQSPGGNHTNTQQGAAYQTSKVSVSGGVLRLACDQQSSIAGLPYTAGMISSKDLLEQEYGAFEARLRIVGARNSRHWPAWWMFNSVFNQWPPEIDVWELFGTAGEYLTNIYRPSPGGNEVGHNTFNDFGNFHTYGCRWTADAVTFYRDGVQTYEIDPSVSGPQFLVLNNGAEWPEGGSAPTGTMPVVEVEHVRAWALPE